VLPKGDTMAKMTLIAEHLDEYKDKGKYRYRFKRGVPLEVNPSFALGSLGNPLFTIEFDRKDHHFLDNVDQNGKNVLKQFSVNLGSLSRTIKIPMKKDLIPPIQLERIKSTKEEKKKAEIKPPLIKKAEIKPPLLCANCTKELTGKQKKFCSRACSVEHRRGIKKQ